VRRDLLGHFAQQRVLVIAGFVQDRGARVDEGDAADGGNGDGHQQSDREGQADAQRHLPRGP